MNLVDRYAEELRRSHEELAGIMDKLRIRKLKQAGRIAVSINMQLGFVFVFDLLRKCLRW